MYAEYIVRFIVILSRGTEVRVDDNALSFCPFARMRIARSAEAAFAIDPLTRATRAFERIDESQNHLITIPPYHSPHLLSLSSPPPLLFSHSSMIHPHRKLYYPGKLNESESELKQKKK